MCEKLYKIISIRFQKQDYAIGNISKKISLLTKNANIWQNNYFWMKEKGYTLCNFEKSLILHRNRNVNKNERNFIQIVRLYTW